MVVLSAIGARWLSQLSILLAFTMSKILTVGLSKLVTEPHRSQTMNEDKPSELHPNNLNDGDRCIFLYLSPYALHTKLHRFFKTIVVKIIAHI